MISKGTFTYRGGGGKRVVNSKDISETLTKKLRPFFVCRKKSFNLAVTSDFLKLQALKF